MNFLPRVNYVYRKCNTCNGTGWHVQHTELGFLYYECSYCDGTGEVLEVESVEDSNELIEEEMWEDEINGYKTKKGRTISKG